MKTLITILIGTLLVGCAAGLGSFYIVESHRNLEKEQQELQQKYEKEQQELRQKYERELAQAQREYRIPPAAPMPAPPSPLPNKPYNYKLESQSTDPTGSGRKIDIIPTNPIKAQREKETVSSKLFSANLAFAIKDKANIEEDIKAQLLIDPNKSIESLKNDLRVRGQTVVKNIDISEVVKATLTAPEFTVTKITEEEQIISDNKSTEWLWTLKPKSVGIHEINLSVTAIIKVNGRESKHHLKTFEQKVLIEITQQQIIENWLYEHWKWILSTLVFPFIVFIFKDKFKRWLSKREQD